MSVFSDDVKFRTRGEGDVVNITKEVGAIVKKSGIANGIVCASVVGSTAALTTVEYEPGLVSDLAEAAERLFPKGIEYEHHARWGDGNGHSHVRASFVGPSVTLPVRKGAPVLGAWQQIVLLEYDVRPRERTVVVQVIGD